MKSHVAIVAGMVRCIASALTGPVTKQLLRGAPHFQKPNMKRTITLLIALLPLIGGAAEPLFETSVVFPVAPGNKPNYRIPSILQAPDGDLLIFAEKRNDGIGDIGNHDIVLKRSRDKGRTWSDMEPVLMVTSQSAATAAVLGIDDGVSVQNVDQPKLRERLLAAKQVLEWKPSK